MAYTHLDPGQELEISAHIYFSPSQMDISELVKLSPEQLKAQEADSVEQEKAIYEKFNEIEKEWAKQAMLTLSLRKAQQYLKVQPAPHTSNQWTEDQYGRHEMSNMVYCFSWREYERTGWSRAEQKSVPVAWELSWSLHFNTIPNPDYSGSGWQLLNISTNQMSYITSAEAGHGLIRVGGSIVPFANEFPRDTELYRLMTTTPGDGRKDRPDQKGLRYGPGRLSVRRHGGTASGRGGQADRLRLL